MTGRYRQGRGGLVGGKAMGGVKKSVKIIIYFVGLKNVRIFANSIGV